MTSRSGKSPASGPSGQRNCLLALLLFLQGICLCALLCSPTAGPAEHAGYGLPAASWNDSSGHAHRHEICPARDLGRFTPSPGPAAPPAALPPPPPAVPAASFRHCRSEMIPEPAAFPVNILRLTGSLRC